MFKSWTRENAEAAKALFGHPGRVLLAAWVLSRGGESFFQQEATTAIALAGEATTSTQAALKSFVSEGLLMKVPDGHRLYYTALEHPLWDAYAAIARAFGLPSGAEIDQSKV
jgi:hypothetical protein